MGADPWTRAKRDAWCPGSRDTERGQRRQESPGEEGTSAQTAACRSVSQPGLLQLHPMASPSRQPPLGGSGLLRGSRARSYGSLVQSACSPVRERRLEHQLAPGDTLAGLALKYGVTVSPSSVGVLTARWKTFPPQENIIHYLWPGRWLHV